MKSWLLNDGFGGLIFVSFGEGMSLPIQEVELLKGGCHFGCLAEILWDIQLSSGNSILFNIAMENCHL